MTHLRRVMLEELQRRNYATTTVQYYIQAVERFAKHFHRPPDQLNQASPARVSGVSPARAKARAADGQAPRLRTPILLRQDVEAPLPARRHSVSEGPASIADDPDGGRSHPIDRCRAHAHRPCDVDGAVLNGHAERRDAESAGQRHRQSGDADSHPAWAKVVAIGTSRSARLCWRPCACTGAG